VSKAAFADAMGRALAAAGVELVAWCPDRGDRTVRFTIIGTPKEPVLVPTPAVPVIPRPEQVW